MVPLLQSGVLLQRSQGAKQDIIQGMIQRQDEDYYYIYRILRGSLLTKLSYNICWIQI
jgi:hypothetical protein